MKTTLLGMHAALALATFPACSSAEDDDTGSTADATVELSDNQFSPAQVTIKVGQTVRWKWSGSTHSVVSGSDCSTEDGKFKSGEPASGGVFDKKFETAGTFPYYCQPHCSMGMKGTVVVEP